VVIVSPSLICYGVKNNMVRVIDAHTMAKTLLKGHSQPVSDMSFGSSDSIATIALDVRWEVGGAELTAPQAECILWDVRPVDEQTISTRESLRLRAPAGHGMQCVKFHPRSNGQVLVVAHGPDVSAVVLSARLWQLFSQDPTHALGIDSVAALKLTGHTENVNAFEFSEDGSRCVSAGEDGVCCVWALPPLEHILNASALGVLRPLAQIFPEPSQPILHASFVAANVVCLGMAHNTEVAFWSLQQERLQTLRLVPAQQGETAKNKMAVVKGPKVGAACLPACLPWVRLTCVLARGCGRGRTLFWRT
jgi:WD40 repeat protein